MNTKKLGNIGEAKVIAEFVSLGIPVYIPFGDNEKSDLIVEVEGNLYKIQVKTSKKAEDGIMKFSINSSSSRGKYDYTKDDIDYFALYNLERDVILLISVEETDKEQVTFRYEKTKNNQKVGVKYEKDYLLKDKIPYKL